jgi:superfamily II DNA/RNA helicase
VNVQLLADLQLLPRQVPSLDSFLRLESLLPPFLHRNLTAADRMGYSVPTPVQRHCVPLSLSGDMDVMA